MIVNVQEVLTYTIQSFVENAVFFNCEVCVISKSFCVVRPS